MKFADGCNIALRMLEGFQAPAGLSSHTCNWRGIEYPCTVNTERRGELVELGGEMVEVAITIIIRKALLDPRHDISDDDITGDDDTITADDDTIQPAPNHSIKLTSRNRTYSIATVRLDGAQSHYSLDCVDNYMP